MSAQVTVAPPDGPVDEVGTDADDDGRIGDPVRVWVGWLPVGVSSLPLSTTIATITAAATTTTATIAMIRFLLPPATRAGAGP